MRRMKLLVPIITMSLLGAAQAADAQARRQGPDQKTVPVTLDLKIGSESVQGSGPGRCTHAPAASIYDVRAQMWTAAYESEGKPVQLTFWRPTDKSPDMFGLQAPRVNISTVRGGKPNGSGTVTFEPSAKGGIFKIQAKGADGTTVAGSIKCEGFLPHVAEGG
jgi:hypothetical protein